MIYLYTDYENLFNKSITDHDSFFKKAVAHNMDSVDLKYIKEIDGAEIVNKKPYRIQTRFGIGSLDDLSQGLKVLLNIRYLKKIGKSQELVDIISCGDNIIPYIINESVGCDLRLLTPYRALGDNTRVDIVVNDSEHINSFIELIKKEKRNNEY